MIRKYKKLIIIGISVVVLLSLIFVILSIFINKETKITTYNISATVDENKLKGILLLEYLNNNDFAVNELCFCLYANAFKNEENIKNVAVSDRIAEAYPNGFDSGYIDVTSVSVNGEPVEYFIENDEQILRVNTGVIKKGERIELNIEFKEKLPNSPMRFGYGEDTYNFGNWYPVLCPFENGEAIKSIYTSNGDPFYSECAAYNVEIDVPSEFRVATSGKIISKSTQNPLYTKWIIHGRDIRDFAFVISENFKLKSQMVGNTLVYSYYLLDDKMGEKALEYAKNALLCFNKLYGEYPYETFSVVATDFYIGGMEYPNMVMIDKNLYSTLMEEALEEVIVHEVAHQWWYGVVGNNEIKEPWLDEGLTQYSVALYLEKTYGKERYKTFLNENELYCKIVFELMEKNMETVNKKIDRPSKDFDNWLLYDALCYDVCALMYDSLRATIGDQSFFDGLRAYYNEYKYKNSTRNDFINCMENNTSKNVKGIIMPWLDGNIYWG